MKPEDRQRILKTTTAAVGACTACARHRTRRAALPGTGPLKADVLFVTPAPSDAEDSAGDVLIGAAGMFFDHLLQQIGLTRAQVFVTPLVKCHANAPPTEAECLACEGYLQAQLHAVDPLVVGLLGHVSLGYFFPQADLIRQHGQPLALADRFYMPLHHPAAAEQNPALRSVLLSDFRALKALLGRLRDIGPGDEPPPQQMTFL